jgi:hypothetical protein
MILDNITQSTDFTINQLQLITKVGTIDLRNVYEELNIFDGIFVPARSGNIMIRDATGMIENFLLNGSEFLKISIGKTKEMWVLDKTFRIYKMTNRTKVNETSETYVLHFVSDEYVYSEQQKIDQACKGTYSGIALDIFNQYLNVTEKQLGLVDQSIGQKEFIMPALNPFDSINYCAKRSVDSDGAPNFLFFENMNGYNFCSLSTLVKQKPNFNLNFDVKNVGETLDKDIFGVRKYEVLSQFDYIKSTQSGVYSGKFIGFDPLTRKLVVSEKSFINQYSSTEHSNPNPAFVADKNKSGKFNFEMFDSRVVFYTFSEAAKYSNYIKENDPYLLNKLEDTHNFVFQRKAILEGFVNKTIRLLLPGNFFLTSGTNVTLKMPTRSLRNDQKDNEDSTLKGTYTIIATRHILKNNVHETVIDVATDSTESIFAPQSTNPKYIEGV